MIAHGKKKKKRSTSTTNGGDSAIETFMEFDSDMEFLLLDDVLPTDQSIGKNKINLREEIKDKRSGRNSIQGGSNSQGGMNVTTMGGANNNDDTMTTPQDVTLLSLGGVMSATRMMDQNGTFMISRQSLDKASPTALSRMLMSNLQGGGTGVGVGGGDNVGEGNLRLLAGMCDVDASGALLMPGTRASVFVNGEAQQMNNEEDIQIFPGGLSPGPRDDDNDFGAANDNTSFGGGGDDWGGDDNDGPGFELHDEHMEDPTAGGAGEEENEVVANSANVTTKTPVVTKPKPVVQDPWAVLDKDEPSKDKVVPLRIGVTTRLPHDMDDGDRPSAAVTGSRTRTKKGLKKKKSVSSQSAAYDYQSRPFLADITFDEAMKDSDDENEDQLNNSDATLQAETSRHLKVLTNGGLIFGEEFAYVAKAHAKHRDLMRKQRRLLQQQQDAIQEEEKEAEMYDDDEHDEYGGLDFGGGADDDSYGQGNGPLHRSNVDFSAIDDVFGGSGGGFDDDDFDDNFAHNSGGTFEDLCRAHLRKFNESAKAYAAETELTKRVGKWQSGLAPLLEEQEKRPEFDIHSYGKQILERVERNLTSVRKRTSTGDKKPSSSQTNNEVGFSTIIASKDCEDYEVCRLFLSTLMLCNCGNIAMHNGGNGEVVETMDSLNIELLDATFQPPMENFDLEDEVLYQNENVVA